MPFRRSSSEVSRLRLKVTEISRCIVLTDAMVQERAQSPYKNRLKTAHLLCLLLGLLLVSNARAYKPRIRPRMSSAAIPKFLASSRFAVVGASTVRSKFGNKVLRCYQENGKTVVPINPKEAEIEGIPCLANLAALDNPSDVAVSVITPPKVTVGILEEAAKLGISKIWLQPGCEDDSVISKQAELGLKDVIYGGPCVLVELGFGDHS